MGESPFRSERSSPQNSELLCCQGVPQLRDTQRIHKAQPWTLLGGRAPSEGHSVEHPFEAAGTRGPPFHCTSAWQKRESRSYAAITSKHSPTLLRPCSSARQLESSHEQVVSNVRLIPRTQGIVRQVTPRNTHNTTGTALGRKESDPATRLAEHGDDVSSTFGWKAAGWPRRHHEGVNRESQSRARESPTLPAQSRTASLALVNPDEPGGAQCTMHERVRQVVH